ncbi:MAG: transcription termination factor Rho [Verrucomicrobiota bacterium]
MSNDTNEDTMPQQASDEAAPARKRAAKKAATKAPAKKAATKKVAAKKVTAKKVATKSAKSASAVVHGTLDLPFAEPLTTTPLAAPEPTRAPRARKPATAPEASAEPVQQHSEDGPRRFGRVPGGGPVASREAPEAREPKAQSPTPFPEARQDGSESGSDSRRESRPPQHDGQQTQQRDGQGPPRESRSKRRREKRKRRRNERTDQGGPPQPQQRQRHEHPDRHERHDRQDRHDRQPSSNEQDDRRPSQLSGPKIEADGMLELAPKGFGFLRIPGKNFEQARDDVFVTPEIIRRYNLRLGQWIHGVYQEGPRGPQLVEISKVNDLTPEEASKLPHFDELKAINPSKRISFETTPERFTTRVVDIMAPVGRGQRGLIVSPPRSGKTTLLLHMAEAIREKYDEGAIHLMVVLVDERPEEVTEFRRALPGAEIYASSNDEQARSHTRIAELAIERAKRLVEAGRDVFLIMDSITRLARAYNGNMNNRGRGTGSGGITIGALEVPRRLFAAARNTRGGGSLTIMATALIQTNSRADEAIYMEFKGTGNMELVLDRKIAENYIYPAVDIFKSGTRREELLLADHMLHKIHLIRRGLSGHRPAEAMERLLFFLKKFPNNPQMLLEIKG